MAEKTERPQWLRGDLRYVELPEPPAIQKYVGGQSTDVDNAYAHALAADNPRRLTAGGCDLVSIRFFAGFGMDFEAPEFERSGQFIKHAHKAGLKVAARVSLGWAIPETLIHEEHDSQNWMQLTHDGKSVWSAQSFQCRPCYNSEGWLRYVEKATTLAINAGADLIFFDGAGYTPTVRACHCPLCVATFRDYLRNKFGSQDDVARQAGLERFGHNAFVHVRPPVEAIASAINAPHQQEWILFKVRTVTEALSRLAGFVRRRNHACAVGAEVFDTFFAAGSEYLFGVDPSQWLPMLDAAFMREPRLVLPRQWSAADCAQRAVNTNLNAKVARAFGSVLLDMLQPPSSEQLGLLMPARMGVFHDGPSAAFNTAAADSRHELEVTLLERGVPFDVLHAANLGALEKYPCVVLPGCECLSDELASEFEQYVQKGGGIIVTEATGRYDPWRRVRTQNALARSLGIPPNGKLFKEFGQGRVAYLPRCSEDWTSFEEAVMWLMGEEKEFELKGG